MYISIKMKIFTINSYLILNNSVEIKDGVLLLNKRSQ